MIPWTAHPQPLDPQTTRIILTGDNRDRPLSFAGVISLWSDSAAFRAFFTATLARSSLDAFFWETPPVTPATLSRPFEFVLVASASLARLRPDPAPFRGHFAAHPNQSVLTFPNLGGDAVLIVPAPLAPAACYPHLARFLRGAPPVQVDPFWQAVGRAMRQRTASASSSPAPVWLSTAGMGVSWLHLRLDSRPKYYRHPPYTTFP